MGFWSWAWAISKRCPGLSPYTIVTELFSIAFSLILRPSDKGIVARPDYTNVFRIILDDAWLAFKLNAWRIGKWILAVYGGFLLITILTQAQQYDYELFIEKEREHVLWCETAPRGSPRPEDYLQRKQWLEDNHGPFLEALYDGRRKTSLCGVLTCSELYNQISPTIAGVLATPALIIIIIVAGFYAFYSLAVVHIRRNQLAEQGQVPAAAAAEVAAGGKKEQ